MRKLVTALVIMLACTLQSCQKETSIDTTQQPADTTQETGGPDSSFLPRAIAAIPADPGDEALAVSLKYLNDQHQIQVYLDDTTTTDPYDHLVLSYFYNSDGYFTKREGYDAAGSISNMFYVERTSDNTLKTVMVRDKDTVLQQTFSDTFAISFSDSASYKRMTVANTVYFPSDAVKVQNNLVFQNNRLVAESGGQFNGQSSSIGRPALTYNYDASGRLTTVNTTGYYGTSYSYESTGRSLDSFFSLLGGKDGYLFNVDGLWSYNAQAEFNFFPLYVILANRNVELYAEMHKHGVLKEVRSIPNGADFPYTEVFDFQNTFDDKQRITETKITNNGRLYATWKIKY